MELVIKNSLYLVFYNPNDDEAGDDENGQNTNDNRDCPRKMCCFLFLTNLTFIYFF